METSGNTGAPAYVVIEIDVKDSAGYLKDFAPVVDKAIASQGGKYLARGGKTASIDGAPAKSRVVIYVFKDLAHAQAALTSAAYLDARKIGNKYATFRSFAVEGLPQ